MPEYRLLPKGEPPPETKRYHVFTADEEPREAKRYRGVREAQHYRLVQDQQERRERAWAEIVTCVRCGQWVHDPENGQVCAECQAADIEDENREEIEVALGGRCQRGRLLLPGVA